MFSFDHSITIDRPVAEVFAYTADPHNIPRWRPEVLEVRGARSFLSRPDPPSPRSWRFSEGRSSALSCATGRPTTRWCWRT
ncbi:SRPBCC family protein [Pseudonocardia sp. GCM10023141]|uniref:SRPBCC family protein n=1 Tax=Pseudonocardia sp. GCM10023141 TaxID=3252653 RepID=UPI00361753DD